MLPYRLMGGGDIFNSKRILGNKSFTVLSIRLYPSYFEKDSPQQWLYYIFHFFRAIVAAVIIVNIINSIEHAPYIYPSRINTLHCLSLKNTHKCNIVLT